MRMSQEDAGVGLAAVDASRVNNTALDDLGAGTGEAPSVADGSLADGTGASGNASKIWARTAVKSPRLPSRTEKPKRLLWYRPRSAEMSARRLASRLPQRLTLRQRPQRR
eukprot:TRINITY_DN9271_c0_g1_i1.p1 TRINITY_DN9271_c0_g1~~TRINITY_DN9271_c0_g1_i1.p1  ORF type:complete len:110 (-),score=5.73 TRINITY_DN9271_c0_g1_i1:230-559(-)